MPSLYTVLNVFEFGKNTRYLLPKVLAGLFHQKETERELDTGRTSELLGSPGYKWTITRRVSKSSGRHH